MTLQQAWTRALPALADDPELDLACSGLAITVGLASGPWNARLRLGEKREAVEPDAKPATVSLGASEETWAKVLRSAPPPGYQSVSALARLVPDFRLEGDPLVLAQSLHALERLLEILRGEPRPPPASAVRRDWSLIRGAYREIDEPSTGTARIYYERAGSGIPLVMLHTAGADCRQYHYLLSDVEIARRWELCAFDMPMHGNSSPIGKNLRRWRLREAAYAAWCVRFIEEVVRRPVVLMGCSMGAAISVVLAAGHPEWLRGVIALEAPLRAPGRGNQFLCHAQVNQASYAPSYVRGLMSPVSPAEHKTLACWYYGQGGMGVYAGDLEFYSQEFDGLRHASRIDARRTPLYFLTGEYDYSASPASTQELAAAIPGARFAAMPGLGHFPMTENPDAFREHLMPILEQLYQNQPTE